MSTVLDASALMAYLHQEPGWEQVQAVMSDSCIGAVNWSEIAQKSIQKGMDVVTVRILLEGLGVIIIPFSAEQATLAASLWEQGKEFGLSLADRACLALAMEQNRVVLTADKIWINLDIDIEIRLIR